MMRLRASLVGTLLLLAGCSPPSSEQVAVHAASQALVPVLLLQYTNTILPSQLRPAAGIGVYTASFLAFRSLPSLAAALQGIEIQRGMLPHIDTNEEVYAILTELGTSLEVNISDYLNRSIDRLAALDIYTETLTQLLQAADGRRRLLEEDIASVDDERKAARDVVRELERAARDAKRDGNYALAGTSQEELAAASAELARIEAIFDQRKDTLKLYEDLMEIGGERLTAITTNREVLIAGLRVIDVPGIEALQILEQGGRFRRSGTSTRRSGGGRIDAFGE